MLRDEKDREEARMKIQVACEEHNAGLEGAGDRAAERRRAREKEKATRTIALPIPFARNRATRRQGVRGIR